MKTMALSPEERKSFWAEQIDKWRESGLSRTAYCKQTGINLSQLVYWLKKEEPTNSALKSPSSAFIKVQSALSSPRSFFSEDASFRLTVGDGVSLHWQGEARPGYIRELLREFSK
jgi:uncharacterized Rmd1/YagE family protein